RKISRNLKSIVFNSKNKNRSIYNLFDNPNNVDHKTIVFESFGGKNYSDSPKYIYEYMQEHYPEYNYIWIFKNPSKNSIPGNALKIKKGSFDYYKAYSKAKIWVNNARMPQFINDMKVVRIPSTTTARYKMNFHIETSRWDYLVSPNNYSTEVFQSAFWMDEERMLEIGYPRNDVLVNRANDSEFIEKIRVKLN